VHTKSQLGWLNLPHLSVNTTAANDCETTSGHNSRRYSVICSHSFYCVILYCCKNACFVPSTILHHLYSGWAYYVSIQRSSRNLHHPIINSHYGDEKLRPLSLAVRY